MRRTTAVTILVVAVSLLIAQGCEKNSAPDLPRSQPTAKAMPSADPAPQNAGRAT